MGALLVSQNTRCNKSMTQTFLKTPQDTYKDFIVKNSAKIEELNCFFREIVHVPSGASIIHLENTDPENLFCLSFQTLPKSSNGAPHILEHTVLCGSEKFPVKDPFFSMTRRSLNTFMNAFTGADFTCYPAASQIEKDFYNLLDVYIDAVFHANLNKESFLQEGFRVEFSEKENENTPLVFKGIVYNEMKGALSSGESRLWHEMLEALFPNLPYAYNSGGTPKEIPNLTYDELLDFYKTNYQPSRCLFFFYGNLPLKNHLDFLTDKILGSAPSLSSLPPLPKQNRFALPVHKTAWYAVNESESLEKKVMVAIGWLTCPLVEQEEVLALSVLDSILADTDASPLKMALLNSGLCTQADAFIDTEMSEVPYVVVCKGCQESDIEKIENLLLLELKQLSEKPLAQEWIDAAIHQLELAKMEIASDHSPFGLTLFFRSALTKQHGCDPKKTLQLHSLFEELSLKVKDPYYLPNILKKYFVENTHRARIVMMPDPTLSQKESEEEKKLLEKLKSSLSAEEKKEIIKTTLALEKIQESEEDQDISCLPKVTLSDVPILTREFSLENSKKNNTTIFHHDCFTNHLVYADIAFDLPNLKDEEIPYLQLLLSLLPELGAGKRSYKENLEYIQMHTGGIGIGCSLYPQVQHHEKLKPSICMKGKCLERKADRLIPLMEEMLLSPDLKDKKRIAERIKQTHTHLQNKISKNALRYGIQLSLSGYSNTTHFNHMSSGLPYYNFILALGNHLENKLPEVLDKLEAIHDKLFTFHNPTLILSCDKSFYEDIHHENFLDISLPSKSFIEWNPDFSLTQPESQGRIIPAQVAYNVLSYKAPSYIHPHAPALTVATELLDNKVLHNKIREIGGAYGSGATYSAMNGCFYLHSHRDPHIDSTFKTFKESISIIAKGKFNKQDLEEAKLGIIQQFDAPVPPSDRAMLAYGWLKEGKGKQLRQEFRDKILNLDSKQIQIALEAELLNQEGVAVSFAGKEILEKENKILPILQI